MSAEGKRRGATAVAVLEHLVASIVDDPSRVEIEVRGGRQLEARVRVGPGDMGRVIGRRGRTAGAIRTLVGAAAARDGESITIDFVD